MAATIKSIDQSTINSRTRCLHTAIENFDYDLIRYLLENGADLSKGVAHAGLPLFHLACKRGLDIEIIKLLASKVCDVNLRLGNMEDIGDPGFTPLHFACRYGRYDIAKFLISIGADINAVSEEGTTPLFLAIRTLPYFSYKEENKNLDCIRELIKNGADINHQDAFGWTPLHTALKVGDTDAAEELIRSGANQEILTKKGELAKDLGNRLNEKHYEIS
jgi:ankyrin repeat protein